MGKPAIGLGVIGVNTTNMGSTVSLLRDVPDLRYVLRGICAARAEPLEALAREWGVPFHTTDYRDLVARPEVDVVAVFSPDHLHAEHCMAALAEGKHVICTKPMVTSLEDARRLVKAVQRSGRKFLVGQTMRFDRQFLTLRQFVERGDLGRLRVAQAHYVHDMRPVYELTPWRLRAPQDLMYGGIVHVADILRSFCGEVAEVHALANHGTLTPEYPKEDNYLLNLRFENGVIGQGVGLHGIVHPPMPMMQVSLFGTGGSAVSDFTDNEPGTLRMTLDSLPADQEGAPRRRRRCAEEGVPPREPLVMQFSPEKDTSVYGHGQTVIRYMRHFQQCLDEDWEPSPGVVDGAKAVAVGAAAWESVRTGKAVRTEPVD
jgi:predicted dehydrogenase